MMKYPYLLTSWSSLFAKNKKVVKEYERSFFMRAPCFEDVSRGREKNKRR